MHCSEERPKAIAPEKGFIFDIRPAGYQGLTVRTYNRKMTIASMPVCEPAEHAFDKVAALVAVDIEGNGPVSVGLAGNAGFDASVGQKVPEPITIVWIRNVPVLVIIPLTDNNKLRLESGRSSGREVISDGSLRIYEPLSTGYFATLIVLLTIPVRRPLWAW